MTENDEVTKLKTCDACGEQFGCGANTGNCWCFGVAIDTASLEKLAASYNQCLCPNCLKKLAETRV